MAKVVLEDSKRGGLQSSPTQVLDARGTLDLFIKSTNSLESKGDINPTPALVLALKTKIEDTDEVELGVQLDLLTQSVLRWGSISCPSPAQTIDRTFRRLDFKYLREVERNGTVWDLLGELDHTQVEPLETTISFSMQKAMRQTYPTLIKKNLVGFDGASVALRTSSVSIVYARAGSYGYSQRTKNVERLSFNSGINRIWCDIAPIIPSVPNALVTDAGLKQLVIEDFEKKFSGQDPILMAEIEALARVEALAAMLCVAEYGELIDLVFIDGPMYIARDGFEPSLTRTNYLRHVGIPLISVVKNLIASPVMKAAGQKKNWTDFAFFATSLQPGERSCAFLKHDEGKYSIPHPGLKRVFFYYKTLQGDLFRYETPLWIWELEHVRTELLDCCIADSLLAGGGFSFVLSQADQFVRIRKNLRVLLRTLQQMRLKEHKVELSEPYDQKRFWWV